MIAALLALAACSEYDISSIPQTVEPEVSVLEPAVALGPIIDACLSISSKVCSELESTDDAEADCVVDVDARSDLLMQKMIGAAKSRFSLTDSDGEIYNGILTGKYPTTVRSDIWHMPIPDDEAMSDTADGGRIAWRLYGLTIAFGDMVEEFQMGMQAFPGMWYHDPLPIELINCHAGYDYRSYPAGTITNNGEGDQYQDTTITEIFAHNAFTSANTENPDADTLNQFDLIDPTSDDFGGKIAINADFAYREDAGFDFEETFDEADLTAGSIADSALGLFGLSQYENTFTQMSGVFSFPGR